MAEVNPINQAVSSEQPIQILEEAVEVSSVIPINPKEVPCSAHSKVNPLEPLQAASLEETPPLSKHLPLVEDSLEPLSPNNKLEEDSLVAISSKQLEVSLEVQPPSHKVEASLEGSSNNNLPLELQRQEEDCSELPPLNHNKLVVDCSEPKQHQPKEEAGSLVSRLSQLKQADFSDNNNPNKPEGAFSVQVSPNKQEECLDSNPNNKLQADSLASHNSNSKQAACSVHNNKQDHHCLEDNSKPNLKGEDCSDKQRNRLGCLEDNNKSQLVCLEQLSHSKEQEEAFSDNSQLKVPVDRLEDKPNRLGANPNSNRQQLHHGADSPHFSAE